jgi:NADH-quinone oxidoreductase subunit N
VIVVGSMISLAYYLRVIAAMWMRPAAGAETTAAAIGGAGPLPAIAGGAPEADESRSIRHPEVTAVAVLCAAASIFFGIVPSPLFNLVQGAGSALSSLF